MASQLTQFGTYLECTYSTNCHHLSGQVLILPTHGEIEGRVNLSGVGTEAIAFRTRVKRSADLAISAG